MFIVPTAKRFKSQTDASPGRPIITGTASKAELESAAKRFGWSRRELSLKDITEMSSGESRYHEICNPDQYAAAFEREAVGKHNDDAMKQWAVKRMWDGQATEQESEKAYAAGDRFALSYSQFIRSQSNCLAIAGYMRENNFDATRVESYVAAFKLLVSEGKLVVSPKAANIGPEEAITGEELRGYARLSELLEPHRVVTAEQKMGASEYWKSHPELHSREVPFLVQRDWDRNEQTFISMHPEYISTKNSHDKITAQLQEWKLPMTVQNLEAAWKHLVEKGELQVDKSKVVQGQAVRITDLGGR